MTKYHWLLPAIFALVAAAHQNRIAFASELPASAKLLDDNVVMYLRPVPLTSPNGKYVAYVSRGFVCVADLESAKSRMLFEVPGTWSHVFAQVGEARGGGDPDSLVRSLSLEKYQELQAKVSSEIGDFQWTFDSSAVVLSAHSYDVARKMQRTRIYRVPLADNAEEIASNERSLVARRGPAGTVTRNGRFLVANFGHERSLIWDLAKNLPRATPYLYLAPSPVSERWLGVEKDTRQLVVLNGDFEVIARLEEILPENGFGFDMQWSPDERFVFWRQQIGFDHYSNWTGCLYDLQTRRRQIFTGDYMQESITFTGNRGEFLRVGASGVQRGWSGLALIEHYVGMVADGRQHMQRFWSMRAGQPGQSSEVRTIGGMPNVTWSPGYQLFTIGLPRQEGRHGEVVHLADRQRHLWKLPGDDSEQFVSPYRVAGFALDGKMLIAFDEARLFALPVAAIQSSENKVR